MSLFDLVFPKSCLGCGKEGLYICPNCVHKVKTPRTICPFCLRPSLYDRTHKSCKDPLGLDGLTSLWEYDGVVRKAILKLKYNFGLEIARELSGCASQKIMEDKRIFLKDPTLVPIPLFWYRKNWRGFNQTEELGRKIAAILGWKFEPNTLIRTKSNPPQAGLMRADRLQNVAGVFSVLSGLTKTLPNSNIILFDDVWTTGTTLKEAAKTLKQNGAKRVWGLTLAR